MITNPSTSQTSQFQHNPQASAFIPASPLKSYSDSQKLPTKTLYNSKYKTELCQNWQVGKCEFGENCVFAHGEHELRYKSNVPVNYKTKLCKHYFQNGYCQYGKRCQFRHEEKSPKSTAANTPIQSRSSSNFQRNPVSHKRLPVFLALEKKGGKGLYYD